MPAPFWVSQIDSMAANFAFCFSPTISAFMWPWAISKKEKISAKEAPMAKDFLKKETCCFLSRW